MSKCDIWPSSNIKIAFQNSEFLNFKTISHLTFKTIFLNSNFKTIFLNSNIKTGSRMIKYVIRSEFECQNSIFGQSSNVKIGFRMSKCNIQPEFECQNMISNIRMRYSAPIRMS